MSTKPLMSVYRAKQTRMAKNVRQREDAPKLHVARDRCRQQEKNSNGKKERPRCHFHRLTRIVWHWDRRHAPYEVFGRRFDYPHIIIKLFADVHPERIVLEVRRVDLQRIP